MKAIAELSSNDLVDAIGQALEWEQESTSTHFIKSIQDAAANSSNPERVLDGLNRDPDIASMIALTEAGEWREAIKHGKVAEKRLWAVRTQRAAEAQRRAKIFLDEYRVANQGIRKLYGKLVESKNKYAKFSNEISGLEQTLTDLEGKPGRINKLKRWWLDSRIKSGKERLAKAEYKIDRLRNWAKEWRAQTEELREEYHGLKEQASAGINVISNPVAPRKNALRVLNTPTLLEACYTALRRAQGTPVFGGAVRALGNIWYDSYVRLSDEAKLVYKNVIGHDILQDFEGVRPIVGDRSGQQPLIPFDVDAVLQQLGQQPRALPPGSFPGAGAPAPSWNPVIPVQVPGQSPYAASAPQQPPQPQTYSQYGSQDVGVSVPNPYNTPGSLKDPKGMKVAERWERTPYGWATPKVVDGVPVWVVVLDKNGEQHIMNLDGSLGPEVKIPIPMHSAMTLPGYGENVDLNLGPGTQWNVNMQGPANYPGGVAPHESITLPGQGGLNQNVGAREVPTRTLDDFLKSDSLVTIEVARTLAKQKSGARAKPTPTEDETLSKWKKANRVHQEEQSSEVYDVTPDQRDPEQWLLATYKMAKWWGAKFEKEDAGTLKKIAKAISDGRVLQVPGYVSGEEVNYAKLILKGGLEQLLHSKSKRFVSKIDMEDVVEDAEERYEKLSQRFSKNKYTKVLEKRGKDIDWAQKTLKKLELSVLDAKSRVEKSPYSVNTLESVFVAHNAATSAWYDFGEFNRTVKKIVIAGVVVAVVIAGTIYWAATRDNDDKDHTKPVQHFEPWTTMNGTASWIEAEQGGDPVLTNAYKIFKDMQRLQNLSIDPQHSDIIKIAKLGDVLPEGAIYVGAWEKFAKGEHTVIVKYDFDNHTDLEHALNVHVSHPDAERHEASDGGARVAVEDGNKVLRFYDTWITDKHPGSVEVTVLGSKEGSKQTKDEKTNISLEDMKFTLPMSTPAGKVSAQIKHTDIYDVETNFTVDAEVPNVNPEFGASWVSQNLSVYSNKVEWSMNVTDVDGQTTGGLEAVFGNLNDSFTMRQYMSLPEVKPGEAKDVRGRFDLDTLLEKGTYHISISGKKNESAAGELISKIPTYVKGMVPEIEGFDQKVYNLGEWDFFPNNASNPCIQHVKLGVKNDYSDKTFVDVYTTYNNNTSVQTVEVEGGFVEFDVEVKPGETVVKAVPRDADEGVAQEYASAVYKAIYKNHGPYTLKSLQDCITGPMTVTESREISLPDLYDVDKKAVGAPEDDVPKYLSVKAGGSAVPFWQDGFGWKALVNATVAGGLNIDTTYGDKKITFPGAAVVEVVPAPTMEDLDCYTDSTGKLYLNGHVINGVGYDSSLEAVLSQGGVEKARVPVEPVDGKWDNNIVFNTTKTIGVAPGIYDITFDGKDANGIKLKSLNDKVIVTPDEVVVEDCPEEISDDVYSQLALKSADITAHSSDWNYVLNTVAGCVASSLNAAGYKYADRPDLTMLELREALADAVNNIVSPANKVAYDEILSSIRPTGLIWNNEFNRHALLFNKDGKKYILELDYGAMLEDTWRGADYTLITDVNYGGVSGKIVHDVLWWINANIGSRKAFLSTSIENCAAPQLNSDYLDIVASYCNNFNANKQNLLELEARTKGAVNLAGNIPVVVKGVGSNVEYDLAH